MERVSERPLQQVGKLTALDQLQLLTEAANKVTSSFGIEEYLDDNELFHMRNDLAYRVGAAKALLEMLKS